MSEGGVDGCPPSGICDLWNLVSGPPGFPDHHPPVISAYGDPENLAALIVRADGGRRKWWQVWRLTVSVASHL